jgi:hypothetical protein
MSIEFGILLEGSTITLVGQSRVLLDEDLLPELAPLFKRIELRSGEELDTYGAATFSGKALKVLIEELEGAVAPESTSTPLAQAFLSELLQVARTAQETDKPLSYFGL